MHFDFRQVPDVQVYTSIAPGIYVCRVGEVRDGLSRDGFVRWSLRLEVAEGPFAGKTAAWDSLTWSERGIPRVKKVLTALGFDLGAPVEIDSRDLLRRCARVQFQNEEREDPVTGQRTLRLRVPYMGYERLEIGAFLHTEAALEPGLDPFGDDPMPLGEGASDDKLEREPEDAPHAGQVGPGRNGADAAGAQPGDED